MRSDPFISVSGLPGHALHFRAMTGQDELSRPFEYHVDVLSRDPDISLARALGQKMTVTVRQSDGGARFFNGFVTQFSQLGMDGSYFAYQAVLRPWLWFLSQTSDCRIFQNKTVPEIVKAIFRKHRGSRFHVVLENAAGDHPARPYTVQYRESDLAFVSRLLEDAGITYHFTHDADGHILTLTDAPSGRGPREGYARVPLRPLTTAGETECLNTWHTTQEVRPGAYVLRDFDYRKPRAGLLARRGQDAGVDDGLVGEQYDYPGRYATQDDGDRAARVRLDEAQTARRTVRATGPVRGLGAGDVFTLTEAPWSDGKTQHLVADARYDLRGHDPESGNDEAEPDRFACALTLVEARVPFRPARRTPKPLVQGPQTAFVVGPGKSDDDPQEIWTDDAGRILVRFHWERSGADRPDDSGGDAGEDEDAACFVRVASAWAGKQWGLQFTPRIGMEVVVEFLEGDPDQPLVTGAVYNGLSRPPYPNARRTQSGVRTHSTPGGSADAGNELRFEDKKGSEELYLHAARDQRIDVKADRHLTVGGAETITVSATRTTAVTQKDTVTLADEHELTVGKLATQNFRQGLAVNVLGDDCRVIVEKDKREQVGKTLSLESFEAICLTVGTSSLRLTPTEIALTADAISINGQSAVLVSGARIQLNR